MTSANAIDQAVPEQQRTATWSSGQDLVAESPPEEDTGQGEQGVVGLRQHLAGVAMSLAVVDQPSGSDALRAGCEVERECRLPSETSRETDCSWRHAGCHRAAKTLPSEGQRFVLLATPAVSG